MSLLTPSYCTVTRVAVLAGLSLMVSCTKAAPADAYGNFEAEEVVVAAETAGQLQSFAPTEGRVLAAREVVGQLDTIQIALERQQLAAQRASLVAHRGEVQEQLRTVQVQHEIAQRTRARIDLLFAKQAATAQQRDQTERDERASMGQVTASRLGIARVASDIAAIDARLASASDRLRRASITNPVGGTVLATYARAGEIIQPGQPLYRIASLDTLTVRAYITGAQLAAVKLGQSVSVQIDGSADSLQRWRGTVSWVSARAEFTPTPVQTREARGDLVYAIKVRVANPQGVLKIGMPADVTWQAP